ncbi:MAG: hypothetical protein Q9166_008105 [cf. Caloplaca sp. 2 TL-2023]
MLRSTRLGETFWIGASKNREYSERSTLVQFYVIYAPDLTAWNANDLTDDHKDELIALQATLGLLYTYNTSMMFGVTTTRETSKETNLDWRPGEDVLGKTSYETVAMMHDNERF